MYTREDLWPIKCPRCFHEFTQHIGRMEAGDKVRCPSCSLNLPHSTRTVPCGFRASARKRIQSLARHDEHREAGLR
jgi:predicted 2-oxoglutarate/Fe(II)-dependent dioxygenase YbiX